MQELTLTLLRFGFLALLWIFVLSVARVIRTDLFGVPSRRPPAVPQSARRARRSREGGRSAARRVVVTAGPLAGTTLPLVGQPVTIGRAETCTLPVGDDYMSNEHARLIPGEDRWLVEDLGSTNGTFLAEQRVTDLTPVPLGTEIRVGKTTLELRR